VREDPVLHLWLTFPGNRNDCPWFPLSSAGYM